MPNYVGGSGLKGFRGTKTDNRKAGSVGRTMKPGGARITPLQAGLSNAQRQGHSDAALSENWRGGYGFYGNTVKGGTVKGR